VKQCSEYRARDAKENRFQVDGFVMHHHPLRSNGNIEKIIILLNKERATLGRQRKKSAAYRALLCECKENFLKITTLVDTRKSKNRKRTLFIALELYYCCPKTCILYLSLQFNFVIVANRVYFIICLMCWDHRIPYL